MFLLKAFLSATLQTSIFEKKQEFDNCYQVGGIYKKIKQAEQFLELL